MEHGPTYRYALEKGMSAVIHMRKSICECGHAFTLKREACNTASSPAKRKRALESLEDTLRRQENNRIRMASMRSSETQEQNLERLEQKRTHVANMKASETQEQALERLEQNRTHVASTRASEVKLGPEFVCTCCYRMMYRKSVVA